MYIYNLGIRFNIISEKYSEKKAIIYTDDYFITYKQLNELSNQIARFLLKQGVKRHDVVGIFNTKKVESYALMVACLKIGAIYVNLDVTSPIERLKKMVEKCLPVLLFIDDEKYTNKFIGFGVNVFSFVNTSILQAISKFDPNNLEESLSVCADYPSYIMFTSGSTGFPKGAVMTHQNLLNFIEWAAQNYNITEDDIFSNANPMYFDNSVFDFYASIFNGATLAPIDSEIARHPAKLVQKIDEVKASIWFSVPSLLVFLLTMKALSKNVFNNIRVITFGGEGFPKPKLKQLFDIFRERVRIVNVYGPTECTCICSAYDISENDFTDMTVLAPLGYLAPNFDFVIIDNDGIPSEKGELLLAGPQVGMGYYNDEERTLNSFIQHPKIQNYKNLVYKTGDLVKKDKNGMLHIMGRKDNQIKHMGYRIELEEVEAGFASLAYVDEVGVIYEKLEYGIGRIKAFLKLNNQIEVEEINKDIKKILAPYMIPKIIRILNNMPKSSNGKIDRIKLKTFK